MCNLYRLNTPTADIARLFGANAGKATNAGGEIYPGYPGLVVAEGQVRTMAWGFPLAMKSKKTGLPLKPKPVNNAREDKLGTSFWRDSFAKRRCLIPVTAFAEAEGERGRMTRTWFRLPDQDVFAVAGVWRWSEEWGEVYSMVMTEACQHVADVHDRMPVILHHGDWSDWLDGAPDAAGLLCRPYPALVAVDRTEQPWVARRG